MNTGNPAYAHTLPGQLRSEWELLDDHARKVASLTRTFAAAFGAAQWGEQLGHWHDLGKWSDAFQAYISPSEDPNAAENEHSPGRVDHSTFGARHAARSLPGMAGQLLAFCIAGHHAGLPDATTTEAERARSTLAHRLNELAYSIPPVTLPPDFPAPSAKLSFPFIQQLRQDEAGFAAAFFTRMLFSALIDADRTATEAFCDKAQAAERDRAKPTLDDLRPALDVFLQRVQADAPPSKVNEVRARVLAACLRKADLTPGFFSLNVPTGGGKTFASLAFALHHAHRGGDRGLRRIVVAIPFTSIIEQTADAYRKALGPLAERGLIEHHSNLDPKRDTRANKLAAENWDAPLIVTTNVQLYESLFASETSPCRKLHRLAGSVIILDEAQTMPVDLLAPTLAALRELVARYGCTVVLCTATQPALEHRPGEFDIGLTDVRPIIEDVRTLHAELTRVQVERLGLLNDEQLIGRLAEETAVLCIVNTRPHASKLYDALVSRCGSAEGCFHLSTFMCAEHRRDTLRRVRRLLRRNGLAAKRGLPPRPCRLISTQLIEAGVDVDFPAVYRAPAGFDSIAQAAGRCNREGKLIGPNGEPVLGRVYQFDTETPPPPGMLRQTAEKARELFNAHPNPLAPPAVEAYFRLFYWSRQHEWDKHNVMACFGLSKGPKLPPFMFRQAADAYQIIREEQTPVLVPYNAKAKLIRRRLVQGRDIDFSTLREAQRYTISLRGKRKDSGSIEPGSPLARLVEAGVIEDHPSGLFILQNDAAYTAEKGLSFGASGFDPEPFIA